MTMREKLARSRREADIMSSITKERLDSIYGDVVAAENFEAYTVDGEPYEVKCGTGWKIVERKPPYFFLVPYADKNVKISVYNEDLRLFC